MPGDRVAEGEEPEVQVLWATPADFRLLARLVRAEAIIQRAIRMHHALARGVAREQWDKGMSLGERDALIARLEELADHLPKTSEVTGPPWAAAASRYS